MKHLGKILGAIIGFVLTRHVLGLVVGAALGAAWDEGLFSGLFGARAGGDGALVAPLFALAGAVAKSDGRVSEAEVAATEALIARMGLAGRMRERAIEAFNRGKAASFDVQAATRELRAFAGFRGELNGMVIEVLADVALADGVPSGEARELLARVSRSLDLPDERLEALLGNRAARPPPPRPSSRDPYIVLGVGRTATDRDIRRAYQRLIALHHPDKLASKGLSAAELAEAQQRTVEINAAYEQLRLLRGTRS